jgi:acetolactate synthase II small subunit
MKYLIIIKANNCPELLERLLRVCRHRGFSVQNINGETTENEKSLHVTLTVYSERPINLLSKQLEKIFGVIQVATIGQEQVIKAIA